MPFVASAATISESMPKSLKSNSFGRLSYPVKSNRANGG
jgi:hypothetical protein